MEMRHINSPDAERQEIEQTISDKPIPANIPAEYLTKCKTIRYLLNFEETSEFMNMNMGMDMDVA